MELTNHSYLNSRNNYLSSLSSQKLSAERFASGKKLDRYGTDVGALSQASNRRIELLNDRASITNLKNARSFLYAQETSLHRVYEMYDKIEVLAIKAANPNKRVGVIWVDAHGDLHTPYTTPTGNMHGMPVAISLGADNLKNQINDISEKEKNELTLQMLDKQNKAYED